MLRRLALWLPAVAWAGLIFALSGGPALGIGESDLLNRAVAGLAHLFEYGVLAALLWLALSDGARRGSGRARWLAAILACAYAATDEVHQSFVPGRDADPVDWLIDCIAAAGVALAAPRLAVTLGGAWRRLRAKRVAH